MVVSDVDVDVFTIIVNQNDIIAPGRNASKDRGHDIDDSWYSARITTHLIT